MILLARALENEKLIRTVEGFKLIFRMNSENLMLPYHYSESAEDTMTLSEYVDERIKPLFIKEYPICQLHIEDAFGQFLQESTKLGYLRSTFSGKKYVG